MALQILKRPYGRCFSGNPIHYTLHSPEAEADASIYFEIKVMFKPSSISTINTGDFNDIITLPITPVLGTGKIDINSILESVLEYELPVIPSGSEINTASFSTKATGHFYIKFRQITSAVPDPAFIDTEFEYLGFVLKGGIAFDKWRGASFWINHFDRAKPFLTWEMNDSLRSLKQRMYLAWLNLTDIPLSQIKIRRTVFFSDGTNNAAIYDCPVPKYQIAYIPTGGSQLELEAVANGKQIYSWEIQMLRYDLNPIEPISETFIYKADNKNDYNDCTLNYRNSLGGLSSARILGQIETTLEREFTRSELVAVHNYFEGYSIPGRIQADNSTEIQVFKGDLGYMSKEEQQRVRDLHFQRQVWWEQNKKWLAVLLITNSEKLNRSGDKRFNMPVEFCSASGGDKFFTPPSVNLEEAAAIVSSPCTATIKDLEVNYSPGNGWVVTWALNSGAPPKFLVSTPAINGGAPMETTQLQFTFSFLPVGDNVITVQPVCTIGGIDYPGTASQVTTNVAAVCVPVGFSIDTVLPDAVSDLPYHFVLNLTGTAPFTIGATTKPGWMNVEIVGSTLVFSGTPEETDEGDDIPVSVVVQNCAGSSVTFESTVDVLPGGEYGEFIVSNVLYGSNLSTIKKVTSGGSIFYTLSSGSFPVTLGNTASGKLLLAVSNISVQVVIDRFGLEIQLFKNGLQVDMIFATANGTYTFTSTAFLISDDMEIKLSFP